MTCGASRVGDQMMCPCGLAWDVGDTDPPKCRRQRHVVPGMRVDMSVLRALGIERRTGADRREPMGVPPELPDDVAIAMARAAGAAAGYTFGIQDGIGAMRAAYRVMLDLMG